MNNNKAIFTLAHQIKNQFATFGAALKAAWALLKNEVVEVIAFTKKNGEKSKRVVSRNFEKYQTFTGTGSPKPAYLNLFVDLAKVMLGAKTVIISCYSFTIV